MNYIQKACEELSMNLSELSEHLDVPKTTIQTWNNKYKAQEEVPRYAKALLKFAIKNKRLEDRDQAVRRVFEMFGENND